MSAGGAWSQDAVDPSETIQQIVVTGSRIIRNDADSPSPLTVLSEQEIRDAGTLSFAEVLRKDPAIGSATRGPAYALNGGGEAVALDPAGRPIPNAVIRVQSGRTPVLGASCDGAATGNPFQRAPTGQVAVNGEASIVAPANPINTSVTVTALIEGAALFVQKVPLKVVPGPATRMDVDPIPTKLIAGQMLRPHTATWAASKDPRINDHVTWSSSVPRVIRVEADGSLRALKPGRATVTAASGSLERTFPVEVIHGGLRNLAVTTQQTAIRTGDYIELTAIAQDARGRTISGLMPSWSFSPGEGIIDPDGRFVPYKPGSYTVTANFGEQTASLVIDVMPRSVRRPGRIVGDIPVSDVWTGEVAVHPTQPVAYFSLLEGGGGYSVDVHDPANPKIVDKLTVNARVSNDLTVSEDGKVLVISREGAADRRNGISIFTLDDPLHPKKVADLTEGVARIQYGTLAIWISLSRHPAPPYKRCSHSV